MNALVPTVRRQVACATTILALLSSSLINASAASAQSSSMRVESFTLKPGGQVKIENSLGSTRIESWNSNSVRIVAQKKTSDNIPLEPSELVMMGAGNTVFIECRAGLQPGRIDLTLYVPHQSEIALTGGEFPVEVSGSLLGATIVTTAGSISYRLPASDDALVDARSMRGTIRSNLSLSDVERQGNQSLRGQLGSGTSQIILNSDSGNIALTPGPASARIAKAVAPQPTTSDSGNAQTVGGQSTATSQPQETSDASPTMSQRGTRNYPANNQTSGGGSIDFAGSDRGTDGNLKGHIGPLERDRQQRSTGGGGSGLKVRILPSGSPINASPDPNAGTVDQDDVDQDQQSGTSSRSSGTRSQRPSNQTTSGGGVGVFAGSDIGDDSGSKNRSGPFERERNSRKTTGGTSGLRVRIIPSGQPLSSNDADNTVFPQQDTDNQSQGTAPAQRRGSTSIHQRKASDPAFDRPADNGDRSTDSRTNDDNNEIATSSAPRRGAPPVLHRSAIDEADHAPAETSASHSTSGGDEAITLKAALVNLNVSVTNRNGLALGNLKKEDFQIQENDASQRIEFFAPSTAPFNLVLLIDLSGSIQDKLEVIKSAALKFVDVLGPQDKVAVVSFTDSIRVVSQLTSDREELKRRIRSIERPRGGTAFYEAVWFALVDTLRGTQGQRNAIVVLSDGVDSSMDRYNPLDSRVSFPQLVHKLEEADVIAFPIYLDTEYEEVFERGNSSSEAYAIARDQLERIAEVSGGQMFRAEKASDLAGVYKQIAAAIRTVYSIGYQPTNPEKDGTFRRIRVRVNRPDAAVRTRKGYYAK